MTFANTGYTTFFQKNVPIEIMGRLSNVGSNRFKKVNSRRIKMNKHVLPAAIILLSLSIVFMGFQFGRYTEKLDSLEGRNEVSSLDTDRGLMTLKETANYLSMSEDQFKRIIIQQDALRSQLTSFNTYDFIPYIEVKNEKFFNKDQVNEWIRNNFWEQID
jgi:hypothetical protein